MKDQHGNPLPLIERLRRMPKWVRFYRERNWAWIPAIKAAWFNTTAY